MPQLVAAAFVNDSGDLVRGFNIQATERTGNDSDYSVKVTLGDVPPVAQLYAQASLTDARVGFALDLTDGRTGVTVELAVEADHTSGFYLTVFSAP
jgi:hypothetical protein